MQKIVTEEAPLVSLYYQNIITGYNKKVENFVPAPTCYHKLFNVKVAK
jgi:ABC-type transport system substrate-binding protein